MDFVNPTLLEILMSCSFQFLLRSRECEDYVEKSLKILLWRKFSEKYDYSFSISEGIVYHSIYLINCDVYYNSTNEIVAFLIRVAQRILAP